MSDVVKLVDDAEGSGASRAGSNVAPYFRSAKLQ